jgi:hypothetical protein
MSFSNLLDVSSFFIGVLINLLLIAMICFYFKRKIDNLEMSQSEQAKMMFQLIQNNTTTSQVIETSSNIQSPPRFDLLNNINMDDLNSLDKNEEVLETDNQSEYSDSDSESESEDEVEHTQSMINEVKKIEIQDDNHSKEEEQEQEIQIMKVKEDDSSLVTDIVETSSTSADLEPQVQEVEETVNYEKYTIKELKQILETNGVSVQKKNVKKQDLISMLMNTDNEVINDEELETHEIEPDNIEENDEIQ